MLHKNTPEGKTLWIRTYVHVLKQITNLLDLIVFRNPSSGIESLPPPIQVENNSKSGAGMSIEDRAKVIFQVRIYETQLQKKTLIDFFTPFSHRRSSTWTTTARSPWRSSWRDTSGCTTRGDRWPPLPRRPRLRSWRHPRRHPPPPRQPRRLPKTKGKRTAPEVSKHKRVIEACKVSRCSQDHLRKQAFLLSFPAKMIFKVLQG